MNKKELIDLVAAQARVPKADAGRVVDALLKSVTKALQKGEQVSIAGFGTFSVRERPARQGRNPRTGEALKVAAAKVPAFKSGRELREAVDGTDDPGPSVTSSPRKR